MTIFITYFLWEFHKKRLKLRKVSRETHLKMFHVKHGKNTLVKENVPRETKKYQDFQVK